MGITERFQWRGLLAEFSGCELLERMGKVPAKLLALQRSSQYLNEGKC
jgi:hypothetical protein